VYALKPEARNRLNTLYRVTYFAGGAAGAWSGNTAWTRWGWPGVCAVGAAMSLAGLLALLLGARRATSGR
jgi:predicted MFS family arabinose efflux permease